jgi:hypothetical protein
MEAVSELNAQDNDDVEYPAILRDLGKLVILELRILNLSVPTKKDLSK